MTSAFQSGMRGRLFLSVVEKSPSERGGRPLRGGGRAVAEFLAWCEGAGVPSLAAVEPLHVATWVEQQTHELSAPTVKQRLAAIRHLFNWLLIGQVVPVNLAASV